MRNKTCSRWGFRQTLNSIINLCSFGWNEDVMLYRILLHHVSCSVVSSHSHHMSASLGAPFSVKSKNFSILHSDHVRSEGILSYRVERHWKFLAEWWKKRKKKESRGSEFPQCYRSCYEQIISSECDSVPMLRGKQITLIFLLNLSQWFFYWQQFAVAGVGWEEVESKKHPYSIGNEFWWSELLRSVQSSRCASITWFN